MILIKALLTGLIGVSLCMANITGKVTDTSGVTPIAGAVVQLEKGGQKDTTDADGTFTLKVGNTSTLPGTNKLLPNNLFARISGNMMSVTLPEKSAVEIAVFDFSGKLVFTVRKTLEAGIQSIALPQQGTGVYLYKVKTENMEFVLKGNIVGGISYKSWTTTQGSSSKHMANQAKIAATISDIIVVTKDGKLNYRIAIGNNDTTGIVTKMIENAGNVMDTNGNVYQTVMIGNQVWMAENLRTRKYNDGTDISFDTSTSTWISATTEKYCYYNNTTDADSIKKFGCLYNWYAVDSKKLSPEGWHVPTVGDWTILVNFLIANGYNWDGTTTGNLIAKSLAAKADWNVQEGLGGCGNDLTTNNRTGFAALPGGFRYTSGGFMNIGRSGCWWSSTSGSETIASTVSCSVGSSTFGTGAFEKQLGFSVRLIKD